MIANALKVQKSQIWLRKRGDKMHDYSVEITFTISYNFSAINSEKAEELARENFIKDFPCLKNEDLDVTVYREDED